jgi:hypothetical protein
VGRLFTVEEAQALLDAELRPLAERMVALSQEGRRAERKWQRHVIAVAGNGGGIEPRAVQALADGLRRMRDELAELVREVTEHGVQVKDTDRGLLDFPARIEGEDALLCWEVGEERIAFWHTPEDGFAGRRPL